MLVYQRVNIIKHQHTIRTWPMFDPFDPRSSTSGVEVSHVLPEINTLRLGVTRADTLLEAASWTLVAKKAFTNSARGFFSRIDQPICLSVYLCIWLIFLIYLIYLSVCCLSVCLLVRWSVRTSIHPIYPIYPIYYPIYPVLSCPVHLSIYLCPRHFLDGIYLRKTTNKSLFGRRPYTYVYICILLVQNINIIRCLLCMYVCIHPTRSSKIIRSPRPSPPPRSPPSQRLPPWRRGTAPPALPWRSMHWAASAPCAAQPSGDATRRSSSAKCCGSPAPAHLGYPLVN